MHELLSSSIATLSEALSEKKLSSVELTQLFLGRIKERNDDINAYVSVCGEDALREAHAADARLATGNASSITGIPFGVKDAICTSGVRSTASAKILDNYIPPHEASVLVRMREDGAVLLGKHNCDAFGHGASNENSMYGPVKNPHDLSKVAGGSSGGSAAAVADGMCAFAIAEDTGGSIRQPAAMCGVVGLRPSYGRNSRYGIMPMASSLDTVGPITRTVEDAAFLMEYMAGEDAKDATTVSSAVPAYRKEMSIRREKPFRIGVPKEYMEVEGLDPEIRNSVESCISILEKNGAKIVPVSLPHTKYAVPTYYILVPCEDSSNLARIDGIRYGVQAPHESLYDAYALTRAAGFPSEVKRRIMIGTYALSAGYYDAYYKKAQKVRTLIRQDFDKVFAEVDVLISPTTPTPAFSVGEKANDPIAMYLADIFVGPAAIAGVPALSVPIGRVQTGLPVGAQIIGPRMGEVSVLACGSLLESLV